MEGKKLTDQNKIIKLFVLCFLAYFSTYLGRLNYSASLAEIIRMEGFSKGLVGLIGTGFFCTYGLGQLVSGFLGDRLNAKWLVFWGLLISGCMNCMMGFLHTIQAMTIVWCFNGVAQSFIWSPILHIICELLDIQTRIRFCLYINFSVPMGTITSYGLSAIMIEKSGWRAAFIIPGIFVIFMAFLWLMSMRYFIVKRKAGKTVHIKLFKHDRRDKIFVPSGLLFLFVALCIQGALKDGVTAWIPSYLQEIHNISSATSILGTMVVPMCNLLGVLMASFIWRKFQENEVLAASVFFGACGLALIILRCFGKNSLVVSIGMLALSTTFMMVVNTLLIAVLPSRFGSIGKASMVSGILNSCVYIGCALSTYGIGALSETVGWDVTILMWSVGAFLALGVCIGISKRWKTYIVERLSVK